MPLSRHEGDLRVTGNFSCKTFSPPDGSIDDDAIEANAGIAADKLQHQHRVVYGQPNAAASDETKAVFHCYGATGTVLEFSAGSIAVAVGDATCTFDLKKNGTTILTGVITLDSGNVAYVVEDGTISSPNLVAGDTLTVVIDATIGTGTLPTGVFVVLVIEEDAQ